MNHWLIATVIIIWIVCSIISAGFFTAELYKKYPENFNFREEFGTSLALGLILGPISLVVTFCMTGFAQYGCLLSDPNKRRKNENR